MSGLPGNVAGLSRNRKPNACKARLTISSGDVPVCRTLAMRALRAVGEMKSTMYPGAKLDRNNGHRGS